ncbi:family protein : YcfA family protein OS=Stanieria cyanosphaera (strain ATCC 29371 / PCC 7437) GN=Sta7437_3417 PE=4 SV=1: YcfA [Gemmata massiliana]|uniref:Addiction module toxin, HicA family n=1 Tax=Gemmata massiliana TaxID=1210884 RepID=A0A6P2DIR9_9BACT|nr:type II toxin-antitoxin system HicA family toxin [Gemmata massiliana]VTS02523.1 family protein : YcfA family protein OS=Stanieria cyanosphaera (strain ATCC 29371 / PCC 7437) GN=Sta7437_3417 PE=4 SV=1: YcfA [Gemmata massiliana]
MKRIDLIRAIEELGCELARHGGKHDWYRNPTTGVSQPVPRYREIKESLAR